MKYLECSAELRSGYTEVLKVLCDEVNTEYSRKCKRELNRNFVRLDRLDLDIRNYTDPNELIRDRQVAGLITKCPSIPTLADPEAACLETFRRFEQQCEETNLRFASGPSRDPDVVAVLHAARRKIATILGDVPHLCDLPFTFGPGATRNVKRQTSVFHKLKAEPECTSQASSAAMRLLAGIPTLWTLWGGTLSSPPLLKTVKGSRFGQVPKSAKTNRPIDVEPTLNSVLQKAYGTYIRNRLGMVGNCIRSGQQRHADLARYASVMQTLATVDKSGASDSIASMLVLDLLPMQWFEALDDVRSHYHFIENKWEYLQKFSSMGNGFTFELETLIFLSLARSCCDHLGLPTHLVSVYGDDVILPTDAIDLYFKVCDFCGFTINQEKSFWGSDSFRESCGADWWNGQDVRVAYMRHEPSPHYLTAVHNRLVALGLDTILPRTIRRLRELVPRRFRKLGPPSDHMYGYLHSWDHIDREVQAVKVVPRHYRPSGRYVLPYALYYTQFFKPSWRDEIEVELNERLVGQFAPSLNMERFSVRRDFKLRTRTVYRFGRLSKDFPS